MPLTGLRLIFLITAFIGGCFIVAAQRPASEPAQSFATASIFEGGNEKAAPEFKPVTIDPVRQARGDVPRDADTGSGKSAPGLVNRPDRNDVVSVAVNEKDRGARNEVAAKTVRVNKHPRKAHNPRHRTRTAKAYVKRHHRALTKTHKRKRAVVKAKRRKLAVKKRVKKRRRMLHTTRALRRVKKRKFKPLPPPVWIGCADFGGMW